MPCCHDFAAAIMTAACCRFHEDAMLFCLFRLHAVQRLHTLRCSGVACVRCRKMLFLSLVAADFDADAADATRRFRFMPHCRFMMPPRRLLSFRYADFR